MLTTVGLPFLCQRHSHFFLTSLPLTSYEVDVIILHFFGGAHTEGKSFDEEFRDEVEQKVHDLKENKSKDGDEFLNRPITYEEVEASIQRLKKDKAPGPDTILSDMLINSNDALLKAVTILIQKSWNDGKLTDIWKSANVKFLAKPGKDSYYTGSSYRPISLTSVLRKCMERIIHARLYAFAEHHKILNFRARWV